MKRISGGFTYWWRVADLTRMVVRVVGIVAALLFAVVVALWMGIEFVRGLVLGLSLLYATTYWYVAPIAGVALYLRFVK